MCTTVISNVVIFPFLVILRLFGDESDFLFWTVALHYLRAAKWNPKSQVRHGISLPSSTYLPFPNSFPGVYHTFPTDNFYTCSYVLLTYNYIIILYQITHGKLTLSVPFSMPPITSRLAN